MRTKLFYLFLGILGLATVTGCSDDDSTPTPSAPEKCVQALKAKYPDASDVKWEKSGIYYVADFKKLNKTEEAEAWFTPEGVWSMTETDYGKNLFLLPTSVNDAFNKTEYAGSTIDDINFYEYPDTTKDFYLIEVERTGTSDMGLYFKTDGTLIKTAPDSGIAITPETVI